MLELAAQYPRYGAPTLHGMLRAEGLVVNHKRTERIYRDVGLQVPRRRRKKLKRPRVPLTPATAIDTRWSMDFVHDQLANGRCFRVLNVIDDHTRECLLQVVDTSISGARVARELDRLLETRNTPKTIVTDNGREFTSKAMFFWAQRHGVDLHFIQPGKPTQNAFAESFNGTFRDLCLNLYWFASMQDARFQIEHWRHHYNTERPHSSLKTTPEAFARRARYVRAGAPASAAPPFDTLQSTHETADRKAANLKSPTSAVDQVQG